MDAARALNSFSRCYTGRAQTGTEDVNIHTGPPLRENADATNRASDVIDGPAATSIAAALQYSPANGMNPSPRVAPPTAREPSVLFEEIPLAFAPQKSDTSLNG
jgi:hypothetical protein